MNPSISAVVDHRLKSTLHRQGLWLLAPFQGKFHAFDFFQDMTARALYFMEEFLAQYL